VSTNHYPRVEFREFDPDVEVFRPSWQTVIPAIEPALAAWREDAEGGPLDTIVRDADGHRWHVTAQSEDNVMRWHVTLVGYVGWFASGEVRPRTQDA